MKNIVFMLALLMLVSLSACNKKSADETFSNEPSVDETSEITQSDTSISTDPVTELPVYVPGSIKLYEYDVRVWPNGKPYRDCWYMDPTGFKLGQTREEKNYYLYTVERDPERMLFLQYIEYFNVPKEVFIAEMERVREFYISLGADMSLEESELPNADILYTFNDEIINHYYRYE